MYSLLLSSNMQWVLASATALGIAAGAVGCLSYFRRQNLLSDSLAHTALPGVVIAFLIIGEKNLPLLILGAATSALVGAFFIQIISSSSRISEDSSMGMILSIFYGFGIMLLTVANRIAGGNKSGLDNFIFGQAAAMVRADVYTMLILALIIVLALVLAFKEWKVYLFDPDFARVFGLSSKRMDIFYILLLVGTIVIGIQAVGVILIAALMIIPAVSARYWSRSFSGMLVLAALFGGLTGAVGTLVSAFGRGWPTGPFIVLIAAFIFFISLVFGIEKGLFIRYVVYKKKQQEVTNFQVMVPLSREGEVK